MVTLKRERSILFVEIFLTPKIQKCNILSNLKNFVWRFLLFKRRNIQQHDHIQTVSLSVRVNKRKDFSERSLKSIIFSVNSSKKIAIGRRSRRTAPSLKTLISFQFYQQKKNQSISTLPSLSLSPSSSLKKTKTCYSFDLEQLLHLQIHKWNQRELPPPPHSATNKKYLHLCLYSLLFLPITERE